MSARYGFPLRVLASIAIAFTLSAFIMRYISIGDRPELNRSRLLTEFTDSRELAAKTVSALAAFPQFLIPDMQADTRTVAMTQQSPSPALQPVENPALSFSARPTAAPTAGAPAPTKQPSAPSPTSAAASPPPQLSPTTKPAVTPKPTRIPRPTAVPKLVLDERRPGSSFKEVISTLSPILCVPEPLLWATLDNEYGPWMGQVEADWDNRNTLHGTDTTAVSGSTTIQGVTQMMQDTWFRIKPYVMAKFTVTDMSLEVTFDSIAATAYHQRNVSLAGRDKQPCNDWDVKYILYAACRYNGACPADTMGQTQYYNTYTYNVCEAYNRYTSGPKKNCR